MSSLGDPKDPSDTDDFAWEWAALLTTGETISTHELTVPDGITKVQSSINGSQVIARFSGGTDGTTYEIDCTITTSTGRILQRRGLLTVVNL